MVVDDSILRADQYARAYHYADTAALADHSVVADWPDDGHILNLGSLEDISGRNVDVWEETNYSGSSSLGQAVTSMPVEIEKKYRLNEVQKDAVTKRLAEIGADHSGEEFEENTLFGSRVIDLGNSVLRLRRTKTRAVLTQKQRLPGESAIKYQQENETVVEDGDAMAAILAGLGFSPTLVYEKFRDTWAIDDVEVVIDRLPFGLFMEIEGSESSIAAMEEKLQIIDLEAEHSTYPALARRHGKVTGDVTASRFEDS